MSIPLTSRTHTLIWQYSKDVYGGVGQDRLGEPSHFQAAADERTAALQPQFTDCPDQRKRLVDRAGG
jgi:hypothetical protein